MQKGELTVTGQGQATIPLQGYPVKIVCHFKDHFVPVPCNPQHYDSLECEAHVSNTVLSGFALIIQWSVSSVREVVWEVLY
jgi:hypothetical protein